MVSDGEHRIALPAGMVQQLVQLSAPEVRRAIETGTIEWQRQRMPMRGLAGLLGGPDATTYARERLSVIILRQLDQWLAVKVNEVHGHREVVFKPPSSQLAGVPGLSGATLMPDGSVLLIMNLLQLLEYQGTHPRVVSSPSNADDGSDKAPLVMVVDDSLTVRRVSQRLLERHGYRVTVARNGVEALEQLHESTPAALLLDIEMPRMDGFELLGRLRAEPRFRETPVAMITSRAAERHRQHAMQLGANAYFGKPYREQELFEWLSLWAPLVVDSSGADSHQPGSANRAAA
jgi:chemosensory pili system protein ChpA (sensor histidine kinase/response regulator)